MKECYFFGTFNPIHNTHINIGKYLLKRFSKVIFVPCNLPPHKNINKNTSLDRLNMVKLATTSIKGFEVNDIEFEKDTPSYTYNTIKQIYKGERINFAIGTDAFEKIESWYEIDKLKDMLNFIVFERENNFNVNKFNNLKEKGYVFEIMQMPYQDLSSTEIREKIKNKKDFSTLVDKNVLKYIYEHEVFK